MISCALSLLIATSPSKEYNSNHYNSFYLEQYSSNSSKEASLPSRNENPIFSFKQPYIYTKRDRLFLSRKEQEDSLIVDPNYYKSHFTKNNKL